MLAIRAVPDVRGMSFNGETRAPQREHAATEARRRCGNKGHLRGRESTKNVLNPVVIVCGGSPVHAVCRCPRTFQQRSDADRAPPRHPAEGAKTSWASKTSRCARRHALLARAGGSARRPRVGHPLPFDPEREQGGPINDTQRRPRCYEAFKGGRERGGRDDQGADGAKRGRQSHKPLHSPGNVTQEGY